MESARTNESKTVSRSKLEIRCNMCGGKVGKVGKGGAEFVCPKCRVNVEVDFDGLMIITRTILKES